MHSIATMFTAFVSMAMALGVNAIIGVQTLLLLHVLNASLFLLLNWSNRKFFSRIHTVFVAGDSIGQDVQFFNPGHPRHISTVIGLLPFLPRLLIFLLFLSIFLL